MSIKHVMRLSPDQTVSPVWGEHNDGGDAALQGAVQVGEALDVQHVHLIHKQHPGHELSHSLVYVAVHHLVDFSAELIWNKKQMVSYSQGIWCLVQTESFSFLPVISVFLGFISCPIIDRISWPPWVEDNVWL